MRGLREMERKCEDLREFGTGHQVSPSPLW